MGIPFLEKTSVWQTAHRWPSATDADIVASADVQAVAVFHLEVNVSRGRQWYGMGDTTDVGAHPYANGGKRVGMGGGSR